MKPDINKDDLSVSGSCGFLMINLAVGFIHFKRLFNALSFNCSVPTLAIMKSKQELP